VERHVEGLCAADGLVIVHPNYWCRPPAMLCGWVDRVLRPGRAYRFVPDGKGGARPEGLLRLRFAAVITTANTPPEKEHALYGDPLDQHWRSIVFGLCGVKRVERLAVAPVVTSTEEQRRAWLASTSAAVLALAREP
jgi:putative NADPH-quinone reductase